MQYLAKTDTMVITTEEILMILAGSLVLVVAPFLLSSTTDVLFLVATIFFAYSFFQLMAKAMAPNQPRDPNQGLANAVTVEEIAEVGGCKKEGHFYDGQADDTKPSNDEQEEGTLMDELSRYPVGAKTSWFAISEEEPDEFWPGHNPELKTSIQGNEQKRLAPTKTRNPTPTVSQKPARQGDSSSRKPSNKSPTIVDKPIYKQASAAPVAAPSFSVAGWDAQIEVLLAEMMPTLATDAAVTKIAKNVEHYIRRLIPDAEVIGFSNANIARGVAFAVAIPEVDIVVNACPHALATCLPRFKGDRFSHSRPQVLQKCAIRACADLLTSEGVFKFRRSAFRGEDPKVTLFVPASVIEGKDGVAIDFSVNNATPLHCMALITECGKLDPRAKELILLVRRWARDRGVAHVSKGHLSPYAWTLLTVYFLQVFSPSSRDPILPSLAGFPKCSMLAGQMHKPATAACAPQVVESSVADLFKEFIHFYTEEFKWRDEAVSVRTGHRGPVPLQLRINVITDKDNNVEVAPAVVDPFDLKRNLADSMTASSFSRLFTELSRARWHCQNNASLSELLEPWVPPEQEEVEGKTNLAPKEQYQ
jgi:hypothetical protein